MQWTLCSQVHTPMFWRNLLPLSSGQMAEAGTYPPNYAAFFFFSFSGRGETESTWYVGHCWPIVPAPDDRWWWLWSSWWNEDWQGKPKYSEKTCPSATLSTTNPTWPDLGSNLGRHGGKPATNYAALHPRRPRFWSTSIFVTCKSFYIQPSKLD
jgi:hypothetical protein